MRAARLGVRMDSLLLSCRTLSFLIACRFIPALGLSHPRHAGDCTNDRSPQFPAMWNIIKASFPWSSGRGSAAGRAILRVASGETHSSSPSADVNCKKIKSGQYVLSRRADFVWAPVRIQGLVDTNIPELTATPADRLGERWCDSEYQCS